MGKMSAAGSGWAWAGAESRRAGKSHAKKRKCTIFKLTNEPSITQDVSTQVSNKEKSLYYLFPGQGQGKRKRFLKHLIVGIVVGLLAAGFLVGLAYLFYVMEP
jgi:hypothetical protein